MYINPRAKLVFIIVIIIAISAAIIFGYITKNQDSNKEKELVSTTYDMGYFKDITLENGLQAEITSTKIIPQSIAGSPDFDPQSVMDNLFTIKVTGTQAAVDNINIHNADRILKITKKEKDKFCLFCKKSEVRIEINYIDNLDLERLVTTGTTSQTITP